VTEAPESHAIVNELVAPLVARRLAGAVAGVNGAGSGSLHAYGNSGTGRPLGDDSVFEIGSITKPFTAILLAAMVLDGEVALDDAIGKFLPPHVRTPHRDGQDVRLIDLATHTAGLPRIPRNLWMQVLRNRDNPYADYSVTDLHEAVSVVRLKRSFRSKMRYSNFGFGLLGHVLEGAAGAGYEDLVVERVCRPLEMVDTRITVPVHARDRVALGHKGSKKPAGPWDIPALAGAGALRSTAADMMRFVEANLRPDRTRIADALRYAQQPRLAVKKDKLEIGLAWLRMKTKSGQWITWHNGGTGGFSSFVGFCPTKDVGIVVLSNSRMSMKFNATCMRLLDRLTLES
jgi:serine-type D-Ala-D-Ala carboxypeptidase/endopeptidase